MKKLFLAWQNPETRRWFPIGQLTFDGENYYFVYTHGVEQAQAESNFRLLHSYPELDRIYTSPEIFPLFSNRLMRTSRPDFVDYIESLNFPQGETHPITILARSEGRKATDTFEVFPYPERKEDGTYEIHFFVRGLRYMPKASIERVNQLQLKEVLYLMQDIQNTFDSNALLLRTKKCHNLGYCPRYLTADISQLLKQNPRSILVEVEKVNLAPNPMQFRVLCKMQIKVENNFNFLAGEEYQPIVSSSLSLVSE
ncbi:MAG: hypothetical protein RLZZ574_157 [Cyanobacteriota bacterium]|jgi:hypothetical protein